MSTRWVPYLEMSLFSASCCRWFWMNACSFTQCIFEYSVKWFSSWHHWCYMKLLPSQRTPCNRAPVYNVASFFKPATCNVGRMTGIFYMLLQKHGGDTKLRVSDLGENSPTTPARTQTWDLSITSLICSTRYLSLLPRLISPHLVKSVVSHTHGIFNLEGFQSIKWFYKWG